MAKVKLSKKQCEYLRKHTGLANIQEASRVVMTAMMDEDVDPSLLLECLDLLIKKEERENK